MTAAAAPGAPAAATLLVRKSFGDVPGRPVRPLCLRHDDPFRRSRDDPASGRGASLAGLPAVQFPESWFLRPSRVHGVSHTQRVHVHAQRLLGELGWSEADGELVLSAALWHDIGRRGDGVEPEHGASSVARADDARAHRGSCARGRRRGPLRDPAALPAGPGRSGAGGRAGDQLRTRRAVWRSRSAPFASFGCSRMRTPSTASASVSASAPIRGSCATRRPSTSSRSPPRCTPSWPDRGGSARTVRPPAPVSVARGASAARSANVHPRHPCSRSRAAC